MQPWSMSTYKLTNTATRFDQIKQSYVYTLSECKSSTSKKWSGQINTCWKQKYWRKRRKTRKALHFHVPWKTYNPPAHSTQNHKFFLLTYGYKLFTNTHKTSDKYMGTKSVPYYFNAALGRHVCWCYLVNVVINLDVLHEGRKFSTSWTIITFSRSLAHQFVTTFVSLWSNCEW